MRLFAIALAAVPVLCSCGKQSGTAAAPHFQAGYWEQMTEVVQPRDLSGTRRARNRCITAEQGERPAALFERAARDSHCELRDFTLANGEMHGRSVCTVRGNGLNARSTSTMTGRYTDTSYEMTVRGEVRTDGGQVWTMETRSNGHRTRDCRPGDTTIPA